MDTPYLYRRDKIMGNSTDVTIIKKSFRYMAVFVFTVILLTGILVLAARIPQSAIRENVRKSAEYLCGGELFGTVIEGVNGSKIDRYADSILLAIAYQYDSSEPLSSVMSSSYYYSPYENENENLLRAVTEGKKANRQYLRYWHGSNSLVRPLLVFFSLKQIYWLNGVVLAVLSICLLTVLVKNKAYAPAAGILAGLIMTAFWFVPLSLEYTWTYLLMLGMSIAGVWLVRHGKQKSMGFLFMTGGMVTNYMDFLTTETITLTIPLLLVLWMELHENPEASRGRILKRAGKMVLIWGMGYAGMWITKWMLASLILHENVMPYVTGHIGERLGGDIGIGQMTYFLGAISRNITCLFPFGYGMTGIFAGFFLLLFIVYTAYVYHRKQLCRWHIFIYLSVGMIPYIRYLVLHNHSYLHCFFTYRAQMSAILAAALIMEEIVDRRLFTDAGD